MTQQPNPTNPLIDIAFEDINDMYCYGRYDDIIVIMMKSNGYINATKLCKDISVKTGSKKISFKEWTKIKSSTELFEAVSASTGIKPNALLIIPNVSNNLRGTYAHPLLITHVAMWASPIFAVKISLFIEEWRKLNLNNELKYWKAIAEAKPSTNSNIEAQIRNNICAELDGQKEVKVCAGIVDILTNTQIIEVKHVRKWKHAIGQIIAYGIDFPEKEKVIYLFGDEYDYVDIDLDIIKKVCEQQQITVKYATQPLDMTTLEHNNCHDVAQKNENNIFCLFNQTI